MTNPWKYSSRENSQNLLNEGYYEIYETID